MVQVYQSPPCAVTLDLNIIVPSPVQPSPQYTA